MDLQQLSIQAEKYINEGHLEDAATAYRQLIELDPDNADTYYLLSLVYLEQKHFSLSCQTIQTAIEKNPDNANYYSCLGDSQFADGNCQAAYQSYEKALKCHPGDMDTLLNLGNVLHSMGDFDQAITCYQQIIARTPNHIKAINNIGKVNYDRGNINESVEYYDKALQFEPNYAEAQFNRAVALLATGNYAQGWPAYEWRFKRKDAYNVYPHSLKGNRWNGSPFGGESLLIHCEQGQGDVIQFCRYLPMVKTLGGKIVLEVQAALAPLFKSLPSVDETTIFNPLKPPVVRYDRYIPIGSLPMLMKTTLENVPTDVPYIKADEVKTAQWQKRLATEGLRIGLVWSGSNVDPLRACRLSDWHPWWTNRHIHFYSLQKGPGSKQLTEVDDNSCIEDLGDELNDFSDTAAVITNLDLVISVDTAVAHIAGAMGKPVWVLLPEVPDWRWLRKRSDTPWYPSMRLFRQKNRGDWSNVIADINSALKELTAELSVGVAGNAGIPAYNSNTAGHAHAHTHYTHALRYMEAGEFSHAVKLLQKAISTRPKWAEAFFELGRAYHGQALFRQAIDAYCTATRLSPDMKPAYSNLGLAYYQLGELDQAAASYEQAIRLHDDLTILFNNLGVVKQEQGDLDKAIDCYQSALRINPDYDDALFNLGNVHLSRRDLDQALICYAHAVQSNPRHSKAHCNLGRTYHLMGLLDQAKERFEKALRLQPNYPEAHLNNAICNLLLGQWEEGWQEYEWRFECHDSHRFYPHQLYGERWSGGMFDGKTLLVHSEQGIGDAIQFVRYLPMVKERGGRVIFEARRSLMRLFKDLQGVDELIELSGNKPPSSHYDMYIPLCSLPGIFKTVPKNAPNEVPYLKAEPEKIEQWRKRLPTDGLNVGLVWSGNATYKERSIVLAEMAPLAFVKGINWIGLQKGPAAAQARPEHLPYNFKVDNWGEDFEDFSDTAAAVECMDLVISIDTAVAHLAGALGKEVWILLPAIPDWRWLLERSQTPWYPTAHLFRQFREGGWGRIVAHMSAALEQWRKNK